MDRRTVLKGGLMLAATAHTAVASGEVPTVIAKADGAISVDHFLKVATPAEIVRYHSNSLADAMAAMHPDQPGWRIQIDHECKFAIVAGTRKVGRRIQIVVDDGSPLLADDVTGTTAYADWERNGR